MSTTNTKIRAGLYRVTTDEGREYTVENITEVIRAYGHGGASSTPWRVSDNEGLGAMGWVGDYPTKRIALAVIAGIGN